MIDWQGSTDSKISKLNKKIASLENRISKLEAERHHRITISPEVSTETSPESTPEEGNKK